MSSTPLALSLARRAAQLGARAGVAACLVAPALIDPVPGAPHPELRLYDAGDGTRLHAALAAPR